MATRLNILRRHSESGTVTGTWGKSGRPFDYNWDDRDHRINGRISFVCSEVHPVEQALEDIFSECHREIIKKYPHITLDVCDVPFSAKYSKKKGVTDLKVHLVYDKGVVSTLNDCVAEVSEIIGQEINAGELGDKEIEQGLNVFQIDGCTFVIEQE